MARSNMSLALLPVALADCSCAKSKVAPEQKISANAALRGITRGKLLTCDTRLRNPSEPSCLLRDLKSESRLITHGDAIEHVAWRGWGSVSLGAFIKTAKRLRPKNPRGHRRCKCPFSFVIYRHR